MSRSQNASRISFSFLVWMVVFAILSAGSGVTYSVLKNRQVAVRTETEKLHRDIALCKLNTNQYHAKTHALSNRWDMRERLMRDNSLLRDIDRSQIETAGSMAGSRERLTANLHLAR